MSSVAFSQDDVSSDDGGLDLDAEVKTDSESSGAITEAPSESAISTATEELPLDDGQTQSTTANKFDEPTLTYPPGVEVEKSVYQSDYRKKSCDCDYTYLAPYRVRRGTFGFLLGVGFSQYQPTNYKPDFVVNQTFEDFYGYPESSHAELQLGLKWNMAIGSITLETAGGYYHNQGKFDSTLKVMPVRAGLIYAMDTLSEDQDFVPYGFGGAYSAFYEERLAAQAVGGNTGPGFYFGGGMMISLNSLDEDAAIKSYDQIGLEHTFLFIEGRFFTPPIDGPNLGSPVHVAAGLKFEF